MPRPSPINTQDKQKLIELYLSGLSRNQLAIQFNASRYFVGDFLRNSGITIRSSAEATPRITLNNKAFEDAHLNPVASYWVGFLMADGCISQPKHSSYIVLVLSKEDGSHVYRFRDFLESKHLISEVPPNKLGGPCIRFSPSSKELCSALAKYNVVPRKTRIAKACPLMERNKDFWRGYVDGDGSMHFANREGYKKRPVMQVCGAEEIMWQFARFAQSEVQSTSNPYKSKSIWGVTLTCGPAIRMAKLLYGDCITALPRKLAIAQQFMSVT